MSSTPTTLGKYQIIREIARSNDIVYEAYDPVMNRRVAVKELAIPSGSTPAQKEERLRRFQREVKAAGSLAHPNIVTIYEVGEDAGRTFMAMEFLDGHTLRNEIDTRGFIEPQRAVGIALEVLGALEFSHRNGVIHRDIKPDNIQLTESGVTKLTDFGIARLTFEPNLTMDGQVFGTPSYMSPEQVAGKDIDGRSDLFSVAVVLYEMVSGSKPFPGDSIVAITHAIVHSTPQRPSQMQPNLWRVVEKAIEKNAGLRWTSAEDMIQALKKVLEEWKQGVTDTAPVAPPPFPGPSPSYQYPPPIPGGQPPPVQPYTPYSPFQPTQMPAPSPVYAPVYYPPPPRTPLFSAETRLFFRRLTVISLVVGSLFALIFVGIRSVSEALQREETRRKEQSIRLEVGQKNPGRTVDEKIAHGEESLRKLSDPNLKREAMHDLAVLYEARGQQFLSTGSYAPAETDFLRAVQYDKENGLLDTNLGALYQQQGQTASDPSQASIYFQRAAGYWSSAARKLPARTDLNLQVARCYMAAADKERLAQHFSESLSLYRKAQEYCPPGGPEAQAIQDALR